MNSISIRYKIFLSMLFVALVTLAVIGFSGYKNSKSNLQNEAFQRLRSLRGVRAAYIESYFENKRREIETLAESEMTITALKEFTKAFQDTPTGVVKHEECTQELKKYYESEVLPKIKKNSGDVHHIHYDTNSSKNTSLLQYYYIAQNTYPNQQKDKLLTSQKLPAYDKVHAHYHWRYQNFIQKLNFYDLFLIDAQTGDICYTVEKEIDFATNLNTGCYHNTHLADAFHKALKLKQGESVLVDFHPYNPTYGEPVCFLASPIYDNQNLTGVLAFQLSIKDIDKITTGGKAWKEIGLGASDETYLVGSNLKMRSNSRFLYENKPQFLKDLNKHGVDAKKIQQVDEMNTTIQIIDVNTIGVKEALMGKIDEKIFNDYRNIPVLSTYAPIKIKDVEWVILSEIDKEEAFEPIKKLFNKYLIIVGLLTVFVFIFSGILSRIIGDPIIQIKDFMSGLSKGILPTQKIPVTSKDEIGQMNIAANELITGLENTVQFARELEKGNFDAPFTPLSDKDSVANALMNMREGLKISTELQQETLEEALAAEEQLRQNTEELSTLNEELSQKQTELLQSNKSLKESEASLEHRINERTAELSIKNEMILDSINYARNIQFAVMPLMATLRRSLPDIFLIYRPKDIVSGDFYWFSAKRNKIILICADCTGHGVPGAFMSLLGMNTLNQVIRDYGFEEGPDIILGELNQRISSVLKQGYATENITQDGMDIAMVVINLKDKKIQFAGAGRPLYYFQNQELHVIKGSSFPIGAASLLYDNVSYSKTEIDYQSGDSFFMFSDGFSDQFDSNNAKKLGTKRIKELLTSIQDKTMEERGIDIARFFDTYKGETEQTDDLLIMGFRL